MIAERTHCSDNDCGPNTRSLDGMNYIGNNWDDTEQDTG